MKIYCKMKEILDVDFPQKFQPICTCFGAILRKT